MSICQGLYLAYSLFLIYVMNSHVHVYCLWCFLEEVRQLEAGGGHLKRVFPTPFTIFNLTENHQNSNQNLYLYLDICVCPFVVGW